ncbi:hypothetical protein [Egicoccus halophilus]|uniref:Uncharacterized protein n=1 Tax=Egicoccus halophilus TaxID=1670830 RepID=A0A8J3EXA8_9ACTN|nr:hypothetical protein [Egicoccus halophilus]GGI05382.1 hypothetical protein GCM10011354_13820 [Egicoccus halophilus]
MPAGHDGYAETGRPGGHAASANLACENQNTFGEPYGWNGLHLSVRLGNGPYRQLVDVPPPGRARGR